MLKLLELAAAVAAVAVGWEIGRKVFTLNVPSSS